MLHSEAAVINWDWARDYLHGEFRSDRATFLIRFVKCVCRMNFVYPAAACLRLIEVVTGWAEPTDWERDFLCHVTNCWVLENESATCSASRFVHELSVQKFLS